MRKLVVLTALAALTFLSLNPVARNSNRRVKSHRVRYDKIPAMSGYRKYASSIRKDIAEGGMLE